jgi:hypothetical protein
MPSRNPSILIVKRLLPALLASVVFAACQKSVIRQTVSAEENASVKVLSMNSEETDNPEKNKFYEILNQTLAKRGVRLDSLCDPKDPLERRILEDYGAVFLANSEKVLPPNACIFTNAEQVLQFQTRATAATAYMAGAKIELQPVALRALIAARDEALAENLDITPRDGAEAGRRSFADTVRLWNSRFLPALDYWQNRNRITADQIWDIKRLPVRAQLAAVLELEREGIYFNTFFNNSILYSVAAPGASQHLSMLAFDANEFGNKQIREILADHGWFRTVKGDAPHFTFLGVGEDDLPARGLKKVKTGDGDFWVPNV